MNWLLEMAIKFIEWFVFREKFRIESHTLVQGVNESRPLCSTSIFGFQWRSVHELCIWCSWEFMIYVKIWSEKAALFAYRLKLYLAYTVQSYMILNLVNAFVKKVYLVTEYTIYNFFF